MKVISIRKQKDGSAIMTLEVDQREYMQLFIEGLQLMVGKKAKVLSIDETKSLKIKGGKKYEVSDEEIRQCIELAVNDVLRKAIKRDKAARKKVK